MEQIEAHIQRLRISDGPGDAAGHMGGRNAVAMAASHGLLPNGLLQANVPNIHDDNCCSMCGLMRLTFEPPAVYCTSCAQRIKRNHVRFPACTGRPLEMPCAHEHGLASILLPCDMEGRQGQPV